MVNILYTCKILLMLYHLSPDEGIAVRDAVAEIALNFGKRLDDVAESVEERPGQDAAYVIDSTKARREFGWQPKIGFGVGVLFGRLIGEVATLVYLVMAVFVSEFVYR